MTCLVDNHTRTNLVALEISEISLVSKARAQKLRESEAYIGTAVCPIQAKKLHVGHSFLMAHWK